MTDQSDELALIVHDMRNPLQSIHAFLAVVLAERAGPLTEAQRDYLTSAHRQARELEQMLKSFDLVLVQQPDNETDGSRPPQER